MKKVTPILAVLLAGCSTSPRPYDGVLGYQMSKEGPVTRVSYTAEAKTSGVKVERLAQEACASAIGTQPNLISLSGISIAESEREVEVVIPVMVSAGPTGQINQSTSVGGGISQVVGSHSTNHSVLRRLKLKTLVADCVPISGVAP
jgi:hypothetical protein